MSNEELLKKKEVTTVTALTAKEARVEKLADDEQLKKQLKSAKSIYPKTVLVNDLEIIKFSND